MGQPELGPLQRARRKKRKGEALTDEEKSALQAYKNDRNRLRITVYLSTDQEMANVKNMASNDGFSSVSRWIYDKAMLGASGEVYEQSYIEGLESRIEKLEGLLEEERKAQFQQRSRADVLEGQLQVYEEKYVEIATQNFEMAGRLEKAIAEFAEKSGGEGATDNGSVEGGGSGQDGDHKRA